MFLRPLRCPVTPSFPPSHTVLSGRRRLWAAHSGGWAVKLRPLRMKYLHRLLGILDTRYFLSVILKKGLASQNPGRALRDPLSPGDPSRPLRSTVRPLPWAVAAGRDMSRSKGLCSGTSWCCRDSREITVRGKLQPLPPGRCQSAVRRPVGEAGVIPVTGQQPGPSKRFCRTRKTSHEQGGKERCRRVPLPRLQLSDCAADS